MIIIKTLTLITYVCISKSLESMRPAFSIYIRNCSPFLSVRTNIIKSVFIEDIFQENIPVTAYNKGRTNCIYSYIAK